VHNNAFYTGPGINVDVLVGTWNGWPEDLVFRDNTFYAEGVVHYGYQVDWDEKEGLYEIAPGWGPSKGVVFEGNHFYGTHVDRPTDAKAVIKKKVKPHITDWNVPVFNPSKPEGFDEFIDKHRAWMMKIMKKEFGLPVKLTR
jgi:hypothetical protein